METVAAGRRVPGLRRALAVPVVLAALAALALAVLVLAPQAAAHTELVETSPQTGRTLSDAPGTVSLTFSGRVLTAGAVIRVTGPGDRGGVTAGPTTVRGTRVSRPLEAGLPGGRYEVTWRVSAADGHPISGSFGFRLAVPASAATTPGAATPGAAAPGSASPGSTTPGSATPGSATPGSAAAPGASGAPGSPAAAPSPHVSVEGMDHDMPGMVGTAAGTAPDPPALPTVWAIAGLVLLMLAVVAAVVVERVRRKPPAADPPAVSTG